MSATYQPGLRISEYLLQERIGAGSFAEVWRARHHIWESEHVAIKLPIEPEYVRYLQREGTVVHGLRHPNVVRVLGFDPYAEMPYLVMELVKGPALAQVLKDHKNGLPIATIDTILRGVLAGILAAHTNHVLHRDIKPGNVLIHLDKKTLAEITPEDVKLVDFGLGLKNVDSLRSVVNSASIDRDSKLVGTLAYMAPELRDGQQQAEPRSDLYSIGVMLFEMLTGERPAGAEMPSAFRHDTPPGLDAIFQRLYARYDRRYESAQAVLDDLNERMRPLRVTPPLPAENRVVSAAPPPIPRNRKGCPSCNHEVDAGDQFCTNCGSQIASRIRRCQECGGFPGPSDQFCTFCGSGLNSAVGA